MYLSYAFVLTLTGLIVAQSSRPPSSHHGSNKPNIIMIMTDDQDRLLGSTDYQKSLHREFFDKGVELVNHYVTVAQCCPSCTAFLRGQHAHNTNVTHVIAPGGNYQKFLVSGESKDYLALWMQKAGYNTNYFGKFLNGYNTLLFQKAPPGFDHAELLVDPYTYAFGNVVLSKNGEQPVHYPGYHQTDVLRIKAIHRLNELLDNESEPYFVMIAPASPHNEDLTGPTVPCQRHENLFPRAAAPRNPNFNPDDHVQQGKSAWVRDLKLLNQSLLDFSDNAFRRRVQGLQGIDDIIDDLFDTLERRNALNNTYVIYTADNGYHIGNFRLPPGKCLPYAEDTNVPFAVRGPGIPSGIKSQIPSTHIDLAATFIDIAGLPKKDIPPFLDGRSLLSEWKSADYPANNTDTGLASGPEIINVEFWGIASIEAPYAFRFAPGSTYKTLRIVSSKFSFLYVVWCTNQVEFYDTAKDKFETQNLVNSTNQYYKRVMSRLNALLLVTKSCEQDTCRDPWLALQPKKGYKPIINLDQAMSESLDKWFDSFPKVHVSECTDYQIPSTETPFWPASAQQGLGLAYRDPTDNYYSPEDQKQYINGTVGTGTAAQRYATMEDLAKIAVPLTKEQLGKPSEDSDS